MSRIIPISALGFILIMDFSPAQTQQAAKSPRKLARVAVIGTSTRQGTAQSLKEVELATVVSRVKLQYLDIQNPGNNKSVFRAATKGRGLTQSCCRRVRFSILSEARLQTSRSRAGSRRHTQGENLLKTAG
jgi:hypothetical protein